MLFLKNSLLIFIIILLLIRLNEFILIGEVNKREADDNEMSLMYTVEDYDGSDETQTNLVQPLKCLQYNCADIGFTHYKLHQSCPLDSSLRLTTNDEEECCKSLHKCECNRCPNSFDLNDCKLMGANFEPLLIRKSDFTPGNCCDVFICNSGNYTCNHNGNFYQNQAKWKIDQCTECMCEMGTVKCLKQKCEDVKCEVKKHLNSDCCPICTGECKSSNNTVYKNEETWTEDDDCIRCECKSGRRQCIAELCASVSCPNPIKTPGVCCKHCPEDEVLKVKFPPHCKSIVANLKCNLTCEHGLKLDGKRCPKCECSDKPIQKCSFPCDIGLAYMPLNNRMCECTHQCQAKCSIICVNGYKKSSDGCDMCICNENSSLTSLQSCFDYKTGIAYPESSTWFDGCRQCTCQKGRQYCSLINCNVKCSKPIYRKDLCCPICDADEATGSVSVINTSICYSPRNGNVYFENDTWELDKCTKCTCKNGIVLCDINYCPPIACSNPTYDDRNCCPICPNAIGNGQQQSIEPVQSILTKIIASNNTLSYWSCFDKFDQNKPHGATWKESDCTHCICVNGETKCFEESCREIDCVRQIFKKGQCCPYCLDSVNSPYTDMLFDNVTFLTTTVSPHHSITNSTVIFLILACIIAILVLIVIFLLVYILRKTSRHSLKCKLVGSPALSKANVTLNRFRLRTDDDTDYDSYLNSYQDVQLLNKAYAKTMKTSLKSNGIVSTTPLLNNEQISNNSNTSSLVTTKPNGNYILYV